MLVQECCYKREHGTELGVHNLLAKVAAGVLRDSENFKGTHI